MTEGRVLEIALLSVLPGTADAFEAAAAQAVPLFREAPGCLAMRIERMVETQGQYRLFVEWATLEDHTVGFRNSEGFRRWRELVGPYFAAAPQVEHTVAAVQGFGGGAIP